MAGIHLTITLIKKMKIDGKIIKPKTEIEFWNHGNKTKITYKNKKGEIIKKIVNLDFKIFKKIIKKSS